MTAFCSLFDWKRHRGKQKRNEVQVIERSADVIKDKKQ
jgi:hypothetical protein